MNPPPRVFIASSKNAVRDGGPATVLRRLLLNELQDAADLRPWAREFGLSATYIESLEEAAKEADFAIVMATADDLLTKDDRQMLVPRDNVIFELGLFMGALGRERCFVVQEDQADLHLPTDLLGVEAARFRRPDVERPSAKEWERVLDLASSRIASRIQADEGREKLSAEDLEARKKRRDFAGQLVGIWWERVLRDDQEDGSALSSCRIEFDTASGEVGLSGRSYTRDGRPAAIWGSEVTGLDEKNRRILYAWTGRATQPDKANLQFNGFGRMDFDPPAKNGLSQRGGGLFWNVEEAHPEKTIAKPMELHRISDQKALSVLADGSQEEQGALAKKTIAEW